MFAKKLLTLLAVAAFLTITAPSALAKPKPPPTPPNVPFTRCSSAPYPVSITSITATPWPPQKAAYVSITMSATASEQLTTGSTATTSVNYLGVPLSTTTVPLEQLTPLPAGPGPVSFDSSFYVPNFLPSGTYDATLSLHDQNGTEAACVMTTTTIS